MKTKILPFFLSLANAFLMFFPSFDQTSWKGTVNNRWNNKGNWTAGVPTSTTNVFIGDANFTGPNQPNVNATASCNSISIGGTVTSKLTLSRALVVSGSFTINANGTVDHNRNTLTVKGNWVNNGNYSTTSNNAKIVFGGISQLISGSSLTTFRKVTINTSSTVTLGTNLGIDGTGSYLDIKGTLDPAQSPSYTLTGATALKVYNLGKIKVNAGTFAENYGLSGSVTFSTGSIVEYSSTTVNQVVSSAYTYSTLIISGLGTKAITANLPPLISTASYGNIFVNGGTFDLRTFTANRGTSAVGGTLSVANGAFLKVSGTSNFPANFNTGLLSLASTVEYSGTAQNIASQTYGNLIFSSGSGPSVKTMPATSFTIQGNFSSVMGQGTSVSYTAKAGITFNGNVSIGPSTTFDASSFSDTVRGNWVNNGTFTGGTSSIIFDGPSLSIGGSGVQNFNNISFQRSGITAVSGTSINVSGNISTSGSGAFTHATGGIITMTGNSKTISGSDIVFNDLTISGTVTTSTSFTVNSNLVISNSLVASGGSIAMPGNAKTISGAGTKEFSSLQLTGTITTNSNFSISTRLDVSGTFSASAGTATFTGTSLLSGTANLFNVTLNGTYLQLSSASVLGIANTLAITAGTLNVTASVPNTVNFNGTGAQTVNGIVYNNLTLSNGNTKTAAGNITVNEDITIAASTSLAAGPYIHTIQHYWVNNGSLVPSTGTVQFTGGSNAILTGATNFNILTINKTASTNSVTLLNNITAATVNMASGRLLTGANKVTITTTRSGNGIILGTITRTHAFTTGTPYAFEGPDNTINFSSASGVTSITVTVTIGSVSDFPNNSSVNREYNIAVTATDYTATLRLHYEDGELNGNNEAFLSMWNLQGVWTNMTKSANSTTANYVERSGLTNIGSRWTLNDAPGVTRWNGSVSSDWATAANWTSVSGGGSTPPAPPDMVEIGTGPFTNQPIISNATTVRGISYGSAQASTLAIAPGGSLLVSGNVGGSWTADAVHSINVGNQNFTVDGILTLSNGASNRSINLNVGTGMVSVLQSLVQKGTAAVVFTGAGSLNIGEDFIYTGGTFTANTGTVTYNGNSQQIVGVVPYNNLSINKPEGFATLTSNISVSGNLSVTAGGLDVITPSITVNGNIAINAGAILDGDGVTINMGGNWTNNGNYISTAGTTVLNGTGTQDISAGALNNLTINKASGIANLTGNNSLAGDLNILSGALNLTTYTINKQSVGGRFSMSAATLIQVGGSNNFPSNYSVNTLDSTSTVIYNGTMAQTVGPVTYGNLTFSNGGTNAKTQIGTTIVAGNLSIDNGATFHSGGFNTVLLGNWTNKGTFISTAGTLVLNGADKTITGNTTFYRVTVNGSYKVVEGDMTYNGLLFVASGASYVTGGNATVNGDLTNNGSLTGGGITTFTGTIVQTIRLVNALASTSTGIVNFNGNVSPVLNSTSSPQFATLNINNTAGFNASIGGSVLVALNIGAGAITNLGIGTYNIYGSFTNAGILTSTGTINFAPTDAKTIALGSSGFSSSGIVRFAGTGQITLTGTPTALKTVIISNTNSAGVSASSNWKVDSNFVVARGAIFNAGSYTYTIGNNIEIDGTLRGGSSTFLVTSPTAELSVGAEAVFNNLTIANGALLTPQTDYRVAGSFTNNGDYDGSIGILIMSGNTAGTIGGTTTPSIIAQLTIEKSAGALVTQNVAISEISLLNIFSGTLFTSTYSVTEEKDAGTLTIYDSATLKLGGANTLPDFNGYELEINSNVDYAGAGTTQAVGNAAKYGNLIISGTGNKNAYDTLTVLGNLTITAGSLNTSTFTLTHRIAGNFLMTGGTLDGTNSTYLLNGITDQALTLTSNLMKLTINKTGGKVLLGSNITINNTLNFVAGKIQTGSYIVIIPSTGVVSGASQSTGWVKGNLQKNVATGSSVARTFEIGDEAYYSPSSVLFASVSTAGSLTANVTATDHLLAHYSGIDTTKSVNRFWSLTNSGIIFTTATSTFNWAPTDVDAGTSTANFQTAAFNGSSWLLTGVASVTTTSITVSGLTAFGHFIVGERVSEHRWTGGALTSDWYTALNWSGGVPTTSSNTVIPTGITGGKVYPILNSATGSVNNLTIQAGASLTVTGATLRIAGSINNVGIFNAVNGSIELNGSSPQVIPANAFASNHILNLLINNNVTLAGPDTLTGTLTIVSSGKTFATGGFLCLKSTAASTARVAPLPVDETGAATSFFTGNVTVERFTSNRRAWRLLTSPLSTTGSIFDSWQNGGVYQAGKDMFITGPNPGAATGLDASTQNNFSMKGYNTTTQALVGITNTKTTNLSGDAAAAANIGYFAFVRGDRNPYNLNTSVYSATTLSSVGKLQTGKQTFSASSTVGQYTLIGNPFASPIDFNNVQRTRLMKRFYAWDANLGQFGAYVVLDDLGAGSFSSSNPLSSQDKNIQSGQAFYVLTDTAGGSTITFYESSKSSTVSNAVFRPLGQVKNMVITLNLLQADSSTITADATLAEFNDNFCGCEDLQDAVKFYNIEETFSLLRNGVALAIERRPVINKNDTLFLRLVGSTQRSYQLVFKPENLYQPNLGAFLEDNYTGIATPLSLAGSTVFNFSINGEAASADKDRFRIVFKEAVPLAVGYTEVAAWQLGDDIAVTWKVENQSNTESYEVERSMDGNNFIKLATLPVSGNSSSGNYNWLDLNPSGGNNYYRIRNTDRDGSSAYSRVVKANIDNHPGEITLYPNPISGGVLNLELHNLVKGKYQIRLFMTSGQLLLSKVINHAGGSATEKITISQHIAKGAYNLEITDPGKRKKTMNIISE